jgi:hypothetical protein
MDQNLAVSGRYSPRQNHLLAALPAADHERLLPDLELIPLPLGWAVYEPPGKLQADGLIHYSRGHSTVLDRPRLEKRVCECYAVVKREFDRLLPDRTAS